VERLLLVVLVEPVLVARTALAILTVLAVPSTKLVTRNVNAVPVEIVNAMKTANAATTVSAVQKTKERPS